MQSGCLQGLAMEDALPAPDIQTKMARDGACILYALHQAHDEKSTIVSFIAAYDTMMDAVTSSLVKKVPLVGPIQERRRVTMHGSIGMCRS